MTISPTDLTGTVHVPKWMAWMGIALFSLMGMALVASWGADRNQLHTLANRQASVEGRLTAVEVKHSDFIAMFNSQNATLNEHTRKLDVIYAKLERAMP